MTKQIEFSDRKYAISPRVFNPETQLSGLLFARWLSTQPATSWSKKSVLELGTGCGLLAGVLHDLGASVIATDISTAAVTCARKNLSTTAVDVREGNLFAPVARERFDVIVMNPPYEIGRSPLPRYRSPDVLERLAQQWPDYGDELILAFPTDSADVLEDVGFSLELLERIPSAGRELGIWRSQREGHVRGLGAL